MGASGPIVCNNLFYKILEVLNNDCKDKSLLLSSSFTYWYSQSMVQLINMHPGVHCLFTNVSYTIKPKHLSLLRYIYIPCSLAKYNAQYEDKAVYNNGRHSRRVCLGEYKVLSLTHHGHDELFVSGCMTTANGKRPTINTPFPARQISTENILRYRLCKYHSFEQTVGRSVQPSHYLRDMTEGERMYGSEQQQKDTAKEQRTKCTRTQYTALYPTKSTAPLPLPVADDTYMNES